MSPLAPGRTEALSREEIVDTAIALVDEHGVDGLTMRRLADILGVTPMAIYLHLDSKDALLRAVLDRVWDEVLRPPRPLPDDPIEALLAACRHTRRTILRHPGVAPVLVAAPAPDQRLRAVVRGLAAGLESAGFRGDRVGVAYYALATYTLGNAVLAAGYRNATSALGRSGGPRGEALAGELAEGTDGASFRSLAAALAPVDDRLFEEGLRALVAGLTT